MLYPIRQPSKNTKNHRLRFCYIRTLYSISCQLICRLTPTAVWFKSYCWLSRQPGIRVPARTPHAQQAQQVVFSCGTPQDPLLLHCFRACWSKVKKSKNPRNIQVDGQTDHHICCVRQNDRRCSEHRSIFHPCSQTDLYPSSLTDLHP